MVIVLSRKHALVFTVLFVFQLLSLWGLRPYSDCLARLGLMGWIAVSIGTAGSAFLNALIIVVLMEAAFGKR